jgi:hypothetical protein
MTREQFNRTVRDTLLAMNMIEEDVDVEMDEDRYWDKEFNHMKMMTHEQFKEVCEIGIGKYFQVVNSRNN